MSPTQQHPSSTSAADEPSSAGSIGETRLATEAKSLSKLMNDLRSIGIDHVLPIPVIAIIGSQSAGKSSIVNAISGITLPRASGTCTRCPMECRMVMAPDETTPWSCKIKLRFEVDTNGRAVVGNDGGEIPFGDTITDKDKLELQLRQAQLAVLNPTVSSDKFLDIDVENVGSVINSKKQLSFTPNLVVLEIVSQSPSFTFIDLPGIIQSAREGEDPHSPQIIKDLSIRYISRPSTIILLAVSCERVASAGAKGFAQQQNVIWESFYTDIESTAPVFLPFAKKEKMETVVVPKLEFFTSVVKTEQDKKRAEKDKSQGEKKETNGLAVGPVKASLNLDDVHRIEENARTNELSGNVPFDVKEVMCRETLRGWEAIAQECLDQVYSLLKDTVAELVVKHYAYYSVGSLNNLVKNAVFQLIEHHLAESKKLLGLASQLNDNVFTLKIDILEHYKEKFLAHLEKIRRDHVTENVRTSEEVSRLIAVFASLGKVVTKQTLDEEMDRLQGGGGLATYKGTIEIMAEVQAFHKIAFGHFVDVIPKFIQLALINAFADGVQEKLLEEIRPGGEGASDRCKALLKEDPYIVHRREELLSRKEKLTAASRKVQTF